MPRETVIKLKYYKECKHSLVFKAEDIDAAVQSVYISKKFIGAGKPKAVTLTITVSY